MLNMELIAVERRKDLLREAEAERLTKTLPHESRTKPSITYGLSWFMALLTSLRNGVHKLYSKPVVEQPMANYRSNSQPCATC